MNPVDALRASGLNPIVIDEDTDFDEVFKPLTMPITNVDFVTDLMSYSPVGALAQAFILEAIGRYAKEVCEAEPWPDDVMLSFEAWQRCAKHIVKKFEERGL